MGVNSINSEDIVIMQLKNKDPEALKTIIEKYTAGLFELSKRIIGKAGNSKDCEECVSDVFIKVWNEIHLFDEKKAAFKTWIMILARYKALDYRRKLLKKPVLLFDEIEDFAENETIENIFLHKEKLKEVLEKINCLPEPDKTIFCKRYLMCEEIDSIAKKLNLTKGAVYKRLWRTRELLKGILKGSEACD